jgi:multidrug transporter EmrE-like cation transporter
MPFLLVAFAALLFAFGGHAMKASAELTNAGPSVAVFVLFCAGAACPGARNAAGQRWVLPTSRLLGLEAVRAFALSSAVLRERVTIAKVGALLLIAGGIAILQRQ